MEKVQPDSTMFTGKKVETPATPVNDGIIVDTVMPLHDWEKLSWGANLTFAKSSDDIKVAKCLEIYIDGKDNFKEPSEEELLPPSERQNKTPNYYRIIVQKVEAPA